jgi:hypothetical protein
MALEEVIPQAQEVAMTVKGQVEVVQVAKVLIIYVQILVQVVTVVFL